MTRRRWIADRVEGDRAWLLGSNANHLFRVLRVKVGQEFDVAANGVLRFAKVVFASHDQVEFDLGAEVESTALPQITVYLSIFKFDRMEWAIEKCTELGASRIVPIIAQRTDAHLAVAAVKRAERWRRIALQAAEQSRRGAPPEISAPMKLKQALDIPGGLRVVLSETEREISLAAVANAFPSDDDIVLAIGPQGGWTDMELKMFQEAGWKSASLGSTVLRAETAAIAALAIGISTLSD